MNDLPAIDWTRFAELHWSGDGGGVFGSFKSVRQGTLAELVRLVLQLPEAEQADYAILKDGDHLLSVAEIRSLAARPDFPAGD